MTMPQQRSAGIFLRASRDIEAVKRHGRRCSTNLFNLLVHKTDEGICRVGIIVGRRFGNAVRRNRAKRVFRELVRASHDQLSPGQDLLIFPKREALLQSHAERSLLWLDTLRRVRALRSKSG